MVDRFIEYVGSGPTKRVHVEKYVLFGDKKDVRVKNAGKPLPAEWEDVLILPKWDVGGQVRYQLKLSSEAISGYYQHGRILLKGDQYSDKRYMHLIHHEAMDGAEIGRYLCSVNGHDRMFHPNVYSRYDWCHFRTWGDYSEDDEEKVERRDRFNYMYFVSVKAVVPVGETGNGKVPFKEADRLVLETDCIRGGDWCYGLRITDKESGLAFAYVFGDALVNDMFSGVDTSQLIPSSFQESFIRFLAKGMVVKRTEDGSVVIDKSGLEDEDGRRN